MQAGSGFSTLPEGVHWLQWALWTGYTAVWIVCLIHWLRKNDFYPVFSSPKASKLFFGATFLFFSPLLSLLYIVFGVCASPDRKPAWWRSTLVLLPAALIMLSILTAWIPSPSLPSISERDPSTGKILTPGTSGLSARFGTDTVHINSTSSSSTSASGNRNLFPLSSIWIQEDDSHPLVRETARALHARLAEYAPIRKIGWGGPGDMPPEGETMYDFYVFLSLPEIQDLALPGYHRIQGALEAKVGNSPFHGNHHASGLCSPPIYVHGGSMDFQFACTHAGLETPQARYTHAGQELADGLFDSLKKSFDDFLKKSGGNTPLPAYLYGGWCPTPEMPFPKAADTQLILAGSGPLTHNHSIWRITCDTAPRAFLETLRSGLEQLEWETEDLQLDQGSMGYLRMQKDNALFWIERDRALEPGYLVMPGPDEAVRNRYYAHYIDRFDETEFTNALNQMLETPPSTDLLLVFRDHFRRLGIEEALCPLLEACTDPTAAMLLAHRAHQQGDSGEARELLAKAEFLSAFYPDQAAPKNEIKGLRKDLGLPEKAPKHPSPGGAVPTRRRRTRRRSLPRRA